jgi:hypothetical protein
MVDDSTLQKKSVQKHFPLQSKPKKKAESNNTNKRMLRKGTITYHIVKSLKAVMDALDRYKKKGFYRYE